jgi:acyl carrier protein
MQTIEQAVRQFLLENSVFSKDDSFQDDSSFLEMGIIDSTGMLELLAFLEKNYSVVLEDADLIPENLDSITAVARFVRQKTKSTADCSASEPCEGVVAIERPTSA